MSEGYEGTAEAASVRPETGGGAQSLDLTEYGDFTVPVKVAGEERFVPLREAVSGYMMQADYTRKSQEVADLRKKASQAEAIWDAIQRDPNGTIRLLAEEFGVSTAAAQRMVDDMDFDSDSVAPQVTALESKLRALEQREQRRELDRQLAGLHDRYGDFDDDELLSFAMKEGIQSVDAAYKAMAFEKVAAEREELSRSKAREAEVLESKRSAAFVEGGSTRTNVNAVQAEGRAKSIRDAFLRAKQELS